MNFKDGWEAPARRGLGRNGSDVEETVERFEPVLERLVAEAAGRPAFIVGWSLGGVIARETARNRPDLVERLNRGQLNALRTWRRP